MFCSVRTTYTGNVGPYIDSLALYWDTVDSSKCTPGAQCSPAVPGWANPPQAPENACTQQTVALKGTCKGVIYTLNHLTCCQVTT